MACQEIQQDPEKKFEYEFGSGPHQIGVWVLDSRGLNFDRARLIMEIDEPSEIEKLGAEKSSGGWQKLESSDDGRREYVFKPEEATDHPWEEFFYDLWDRLYLRSFRR